MLCMLNLAVIVQSKKNKFIQLDNLAILMIIEYFF